MDVFIPLHQSCARIRAGSDNIAVYMGLGDDSDETYLSLAMMDPEYYNFNVGNDGGKLSFIKAIYDCERPYRDDFSSADAEIHINKGKQIAESIDYGGAVEYMTAWLNEDRKQANLCHDIDAVMALDILQKLPKWMRLDLLSIIESEAMKQVFAQRYLVEEKRENYKIPPIIKSAIQISANNQTDTFLDKLISDLNQKPVRYSGHANDFDKAAQVRIKSLI